MTTPDGFGSAPTPPAYVKQLEQEQHELERKHSTVKSLVSANHLAMLHQIGDLANMQSTTNADLAELRNEVAEAKAEAKAEISAVKALLQKLTVHMGVPS